PHAPAPRRDHRGRADGPRRRLGLAHLAAARSRREGPPAQARVPAGAAAVPRGDAGACAGAGGAPQRGARRDLAPHGTRALAAGGAPHRGVGRRGGAVRARPSRGGGKVVVSTTGTLCTRSRGGRPSCFNFLTIEPTAVQVTFFRWEAERARFKASDTHAFARTRAAAGRHPLPVGTAG